MKWALIFVIAETGIFETGLTYRSFADCLASAEEIAKVPYELGEAFNQFNGLESRSKYTPFLKCVPTN